MKTAIVTGASGNLGQAVAAKFLQEGYNVIGTIMSNEPAETAAENPRFEKIVADLMNEDNSQQFIDTVIKKYGTIDVAVLTVGGFAMGKIAETKTSDILKQYKLNFETAYNVARPVFLQMMKQGSGRIFMVGSRPGLDAKSSKGMIGYSLGKSLIFRLADLMNEEAKGHDVVTTVLVPSTIDTPQNRKAIPDGKFDNWVKPEAIADVIALYCTDKTIIVKDPVIKVYGNS